jgi:hypothetical protein
MFERIAMGWDLTKRSWQVLRLDKELLLFPVFSSIACVAVFFSFAAPLWYTGFVDAVANDEARVKNAMTYVILFAFYFVNYFVIIYFNSALVACAIIRFKGGNPNLWDGFSAANSRLPQILGWSLVSATVGLLLKIVESRSERMGQFVAGLLGMAWSAVTYFVIPIIVVEKKGPVEAVKGSFAILKRTWGEALSANFIGGFIVAIGFLLALLPGIAAFAAFSAGQNTLGVICIIAVMMVMVLATLISSTLNTIVIGALYLYASEGTVPAQYQDGSFKQAFSTGRGR